MIYGAKMVPKAFTLLHIKKKIKDRGHCCNITLFDDIQHETQRVLDTAERCHITQTNQGRANNIAELVLRQYCKKKFGAFFDGQQSRPPSCHHQPPNHHQHG